MVEEKRHFTMRLHKTLMRKDLDNETRAYIIKGLDYYTAQYKKAKKSADAISVSIGFNNHMQKSINKALSSSQGKEVTCTKGCGFCCYLVVTITKDEALTLLQNAEEESIQIDFDRLEKQASFGEDNWDKLPFADRKCVFLDDKGVCNSYEYRPASCRKQMVISHPSLCSTEINPGGNTISFLDIEAEMMTSGVWNAVPAGLMGEMILKEKR